jgi:hypothetical protein
MSDNGGTLGERVVRLETQVKSMMEASAAKAGREWAIILTGIGLIGTVLGKNLGIIP